MEYGLLTDITTQPIIWTSQALQKEHEEAVKKLTSRSRCQRTRE